MGNNRTADWGGYCIIIHTYSYIYIYTINTQIKHVDDDQNWKERERNKWKTIEKRLLEK